MFFLHFRWVATTTIPPSGHQLKSPRPKTVRFKEAEVFRQQTDGAMKKGPLRCLGYIGDDILRNYVMFGDNNPNNNNIVYTTQVYRDYNKPL